MRLVWTEHAVHDLDSIESYIAYDNPVAAVKLVDRLIAKAETHLTQPRRGRAVPEVANPDIRELLVGNYRLVYRIQSKTVTVLQVFEGHQVLRDV